MNAELIDSTETTTTTEIIKSVSIENMVRQRTAAIERLERAAELLDEALALCSSAHLGSFRLTHDARYKTSFPSTDAIEAVRREIDAGAWQYLLNESGLRSFMDAQARSKWNDQIAKHEVPELTTETVAATFRTIHDSRQEMFERGVVELFKQLAWSTYKSNSRWCFGKKIVLHLLTVYNSREWWASVSHDGANRIDDLVRVLSVLGGKPEPDHRDGIYRLVTDARHAGAWEIEHRYFHLKWFKNGNAHLTFTPAAPVDALNAILARHYERSLARDKH